jgi:dienelactone hydrolase
MRSFAAAGVLGLVLLVSCLVAAAAPTREGRAGPPPEAQLVTFAGPDGTSEMHGFLYVPPGKGPFPAILWNHGSEKLPGWQPDLARFYNAQGYVFFIPHRRGQGRSPGPYIMDRVNAIRGQVSSVAEGGQRFVALHEEAAHDVDAALAWLKRRPEVDPDRIVMSGLSFGGIQTVLAAEKGLGVRAFVAFAPGAISWATVPALGERLRRAARGAKAPLLVVQAANDFDLAPTRELGQELAHRTDRSAVRVYPAFGSSPRDGHGGFASRPEGIAIWGPDVTSFFKQALADRGARH